MSKDENDDLTSGLRIPSLEDIAEQVVSQLGRATIDLGNPLQRQRLKQYLEHWIGLALGWELERSMKAASDRAIEHVFRLMRDPEYQEKRRKYRKQRAKDLKERRLKKQEADRQARMDYSKRNLVVSKATVQ